MWHQVETPSVFKEVELPDDIGKWSADNHRAFADLRDLADRYGTHVTCSTYRRG